MLFQDTQLSPLLKLYSLETAYMSQMITDMFRVRSQFPFLIAMIYHLIFNLRYTMDATSGAGNTYPSVFNVVRVAQSIVSCIVFYMTIVFCFFLWPSYCPSFSIWLPFWYLQTFHTPITSSKQTRIDSFNEYSHHWSNEYILLWVFIVTYNGISILRRLIVLIADILPTCHNSQTHKMCY